MKSFKDEAEHSDTLNTNITFYLSMPICRAIQKVRNSALLLIKYKKIFLKFCPNVKSIQ